MLLARYTQLTLVVGTALLLSFASRAQATFEFTSCVQNCITSSGCELTARCMCKEARDLLLDSVISCMFFNCKADLRNFETTFLDPIEEGCDDKNRDIPRSKLKAAESLASSYISKLPAPTTAKSSSVAAAEPTHTPTPTPKPTTSKPAPSSTTVEKPDDASTTSSSQTASSDRGFVDDSPSTSTAAELTSAQTLAAVPSPATSEASSSESDSGSSFDSNPFGTPDSAAPGIQQPLLAFLGLPLAVAVLA